MERRLKIYRASAGSGKTFTLALEYIRLLIEDPYVYRRILAVTFTNKATGEMKERILSKLYGVANRTSDAKDYIEKLKAMLPEKSEEDIVANASKAFQLLLHDYGHFHIQTIDAFFQSVLRGVARELDLNGDMEISLDGEELLNNAVDTYIKGLEPDTVEIDQVVRYIKDNLDSDSKWRIDEKIKTFAKNLLKEEYQQNGEELSKELEENNGALLKEFYDNVTAHRKTVVNKAKDIGDSFFNLTSGLSASDFHMGKKGIWSLFEKLRNGDIIPVSEARAALVATPEKISSKCQRNNEIAVLIKDAVPLYGEMVTCKLSLEHYHQLSMLNNIASTLRQENIRENRFLLAETTFLLSTMISKNTTFIFEKIGTEIDHIFIDEFQDTSKLQWNCFKVLLEEVLARGNFNLIVGDVKQSIYRWRNSDWNIMNKISTHFRDGMITFASQDVVADGKVYKSTNYRSDSRIIEFNNALYRAAINSIHSTYKDVIGPSGLKEIASAYEDVEQALPPGKPGESPRPPQGYVEVRVLEKRNNDDKFTGRAIEELMQTLHRLLEIEKIAPGNITILMRTKKEKMQLVVDAFNKEFPNVRIVSDEAYKLSSSNTLQLLIAALRYIALPADKVNILNLVNLYHKVISGDKCSISEYIDETENLLTALPIEFRHDLYRLKGLPVYELIEQMLYTLNVTEANDEQAFIYAFLDHASQYIKAHNCDLESFIAGWDETLNEKSIPAESVDSVRIMTIHKSKGLEFHTVIIPFCDWKLTGDGRTLLWCKPEEAPFNTLSMLPIDGKKEMIDSIYKKDYYNEYLYQIVDNLNILYVATTRAKSNLIMFADGISKLGHNISNLIPSVLDNIAHLAGSVYDKKDNRFTFGEIVSQPEKQKKKEEKIDNPFIQKPDTEPQPFTFHKSHITFKQSQELARFLATESEEKEFKNIAEGELMHLVMSGIETKEDVDKVLKRLTIDGLISTAKQYDRIKAIVERALANPAAADWFNGKYRLYNECTILCKEHEKTRRPDRVMVKGNEAVVVDYKFGKEDSEHYRQVERYMNLLSDMGYENVKGYLWYAYKNYIKEV